MKTSIEQFIPSQYEMVKNWWTLHNEQAPELKDMPETSYIMFFDNKPILSVSLFLTNGKLAWVDNYIGNPEFKGSVRKQCGVLLLKYLEDIAKTNDKDRLFCMSIKEKTTNRYIELGFLQTCNNVSTFIKEIV